MQNDFITKTKTKKCKQNIIKIKKLTFEKIKIRSVIDYGVVNQTA